MQVANPPANPSIPYADRMIKASHSCDHNIIKLIKSKQQHDFNGVYEIYSGALYGMICQVVHEQALANMVLEKTFTYIWHHIDEYDPLACKMFSWMTQIAMKQIENVTQDLQVI